MKNAKYPAFPNKEIHTNFEIGGEEKLISPHHGLTKREIIAAMNMASIIANPNPECIALSKERVSELAIEHADELLKQLGG